MAATGRKLKSARTTSGRNPVTARLTGSNIHHQDIHKSRPRLARTGIGHRHDRDQDQQQKNQRSAENVDRSPVAAHRSAFQSNLPGLTVFVAAPRIEQHYGFVALNLLLHHELFDGHQPGAAFGRRENTFQRGHFAAGGQHFVVRGGDGFAVAGIDVCENQEIAKRFRYAKTGGDAWPRW